jgi:hypothetical protein
MCFSSTQSVDLCILMLEFHTSLCAVRLISVLLNTVCVEVYLVKNILYFVTHNEL